MPWRDSCYRLWAETAIKRATANITGGRQGAFQPSRPAPIGSISVSRAANPEISFTEYADPFWQIAIGTKTPSSFEPMLVQAFGAKTRITAGLKLMPGDMFSLTLGEYRSCTVSWSALSLPTRSA